MVMPHALPPQHRVVSLRNLPGAAAVLACSLIAVAVLGSWAGAAEVTINLDGSSPGRVFEGLGALSAGASSRLLLDYPEPQRSRILDYLFRPKFGASLQHLKVEVGGDVNSTDGTEPSHARNSAEFHQPDRGCFERGYEWWLMREAKKRNPRIFLDVLQWGAPGWIGENEYPDPDRASMTWEQVEQRNRLKFYTQDNIDFLVSFIQGAKRYHGLDIDFCGIWNETAYDIPWTKSLRRTLDERRLRAVKIVAADDAGPYPWEPAKDILKDRKLQQAIYAIGAHYPSTSPLKERKAHDSTPEAKQTGKPLWASEDGPWRGDWEGAVQLARMYNRNYIVGQMTKTIIWSLITAYYENLPIPNSGPMKANSPWSGAYEVQPATWAIAHTTQFAQPGWRYLDEACGFLPGETGSYVTLRAPGQAADYSIVLETMDVKTPESLVIRAAKGLSIRPLPCGVPRRIRNLRTWALSSKRMEPSGSIWSPARSTLSQPRAVSKRARAGNQIPTGSRSLSPTKKASSDTAPASTPGISQTREVFSRLRGDRMGRDNACAKLCSAGVSIGMATQILSPILFSDQRAGGIMRWPATR